MNRAAPALVERAGVLDVERVRQDFPILSRKIHGKPLVYLDSAATAQKPEVVIEAEATFYRERYSNVHRGIHTLSELATQAYEEARVKVTRLLNAPSPRQIVFTRGTTESINLVASSWGRGHVGPGDEVLITHMEHHSNIVPWQLLCEERGARLQVAPIDDDGALVLDELERQLGPRTRLLAVTHQSNALGTVNPIARITALAHARGIPVLVDGAQAVMHRRVDVQELDCDFYAFSSHKLYGPTGVGVLYGRAELLEAMPPYQGGGEMIREVRFDRTTYNDLPHRFEAGTPNIAGAVGLGAAIDYVAGLGLAAIAAHEQALLEYATGRLLAVPGLRLIGTAAGKASVLSFVLEKIHPHDVGTVLDRDGIAVRAGHHCAQPVMERFGVPATTRASLGLYNNRQDIDRLVEGLARVIEVFH